MCYEDAEPLQQTREVFQSRHGLSSGECNGANRTLSTLSSLIWTRVDVAQASSKRRCMASRSEFDMSSTGTSSPPYSGPNIYPQAISLSVLGFLAFLLALTTLIVHLKSRSQKLSTTTLILTLCIINLPNAINPLLWPNDDIPHWPSGHILCDIQAKLQVGLSVAISSSATCICRHLATVLSLTTSNTPSTPATRLRPTFDFTLCVLLPLYTTSVHVLVQPNRYYIHSVTGCQYSLSKSWVTIPLFLLWPTLVGVLGSFYAILVLIRLHRHRRETAALFEGLQTDRGRFLRVFVLAAVVAVGSAVFSLHGLVLGGDGWLSGWRWSEMHPVGWERLVLRVRSGGVVGFERWVQVAGGLAVWVCFGLGTDARGVYADWVRWVGIGRVKRWFRLVCSGWRGSRKSEEGQSQRIVCVDVRGVGVRCVEHAGLVLNEIDAAARGGQEDEVPGAGEQPQPVEATHE